MKNQAQIRAEEQAQNFAPQLQTSPPQVAGEEAEADLPPQLQPVNNLAEALENSEKSLTPKGHTAPEVTNRVQEMSTSWREKRLSRLRTDAIVTCGIPYEKRRVKPPEPQKMYAVKQFHGASGRGSAESGKVQNSHKILKPGQALNGKTGLTLLRELGQQTTPQIKEHSVTSSTTPLHKEVPCSPANHKALLSLESIALQNGSKESVSQEHLTFLQPRFTIVTSPNHILNSPFRVERYENALSMTTQERLEHLGKPTYAISQSIDRSQLSGASGLTNERKCTLTSESPLHLFKDSQIYSKIPINIKFDLGRSHFGTPQVNT